jgi:hypothetical protein
MHLKHPQMPLCERHEMAVRITKEKIRRGKHPRSDRLNYTRPSLWLQSCALKQGGKGAFDPENGFAEGNAAHPC